MVVFIIIIHYFLLLLLLIPLFIQNVLSDRTSMFRYDVSRPLLYQIKAHCRASKIAMGSCNVLYTTLSKTIKSLHCREDDCPTQGVNYFASSFLYV